MSSRKGNKPASRYTPAPRMTAAEIKAIAEDEVRRQIQKLETAHDVKLDLCEPRTTNRREEPTKGEITGVAIETRATLNALHTRIDLLFERLSPILLPAVGGGAASPASGPISKLGGEMFENLELLRGAVVRLETLESTLAL